MKSDTIMTTSQQQQQQEEEIVYEYSPPVTSPLYCKVISPLCNFLINRCLIPRWITPDQLSFAGLFSSVVAIIFAKLRLYSLVGPLWIVYGLCDNLDGKQARITKSSSKGGDFVDHAIDSIVASLSALINLILLVPDGLTAWLSVWLILSGQLPFYFAAWAHHVLGRVLLGAKIHGTDFFTVDEVNFLWIPIVTLLRLFFPSILDYQIFRNSYLIDWIGKDSVTLGMLVVFFIICFSFLSSIKVIRAIYRPHVRSLLIPGLAFGIIGILLRPPLLVMIPCFSLLCFELIGNRLQLPHRKIKVTDAKRLWLPIGVFSLVSLTCHLLAVEVTWGLSNPLTATVALLLSSFTLSLLIRYKDALNKTAVNDAHFL